MLSDNSLLLEILRDDIETKINIPNMKSFELDFADRMLYILEYVWTLFKDYEKRYIFLAVQNGTLNRYIKFFGDVFLSSKLLMGIMRSINWYFVDAPRSKEDKAKLDEVKGCFNAILETMRNHSMGLKDVQNNQIYPDPSLRKKDKDNGQTCHPDYVSKKFSSC